MHTYGTPDGQVQILIPHRPSPTLTMSEAETLLRQLPVAIREANLAAIKQMSLVFPEGDAA